MLAPIAHRGPDGEDVWQDGRVAFGHRRLSIIDLTEASSQPMPADILSLFTAVDVDRLAAASSEEPAQFVDGFRDRLQRSVALHLLSDVPLAAMCSGGVDLSLIAAYAKNQLPEVEGYVADVQWPNSIRGQFH